MNQGIWDVAYFWIYENTNVQSVGFYEQFYKKNKESEMWQSLATRYW